MTELGPMKFWIPMATTVLILAADTAGAADQSSLYKRLGGYDALAAVTDDFIGRLATDPQLKRFFVGHSTDSVHRIRQSVLDQLCAATGGPCYYTGRDMKTAHTGLHITEADWNAAMADLTATLTRFSVPVHEQKEVMAAIGAFRPQTVGL